MEQVAQVLKQIRPEDGRWDKSKDSPISKIVAEANNWIERNLTEDEIEEVLEAIISIYGTISSIKWNDRTDSELIIPPDKFDWEHDITGDLYEDMYFVDGKYPKYANKWVDGIFGANCFEVCDRKFYTTEGTRGIGYTALIVFDMYGNGAVFVKDKL